MPLIKSSLGHQGKHVVQKTISLQVAFILLQYFPYIIISHKNKSQNFNFLKKLFICDTINKFIYWNSWFLKTAHGVAKPPHMRTDTCILCKFYFHGMMTMFESLKYFFSALSRNTSYKVHREGIGQVWPSLRLQTAGGNFYSHHG